MGLWDKVKDAAQKAADAAKDQVQREDSLLNKGVEATRRAADKAVVVARDQVHREDSALSKAKASVARTSDSLLGTIDAMDSGNRNDQIADAKKYAARRKAETLANIEPVPEEALPEDEREVRFPNSLDLGDDEVYKKVSETIYPEFRTLPANEKKWALCEIARFDKRIADHMRAIGSGYIDTMRQLVGGDDGYEQGYEAVLLASGLANDPELARAYKNWLEDAYDDQFYQDDDGGHVKAVRMIGWLVFLRAGGARGERGGENLSRAFSDAGVRDVYKITNHLAEVRTLVDRREEVIEGAFRARRASFSTQFLVQKGLNADVHFVWLGPEGSVQEEPPDDSGEKDGGDSPFEI